MFRNRKTPLLLSLRSFSRQLARNGQRTTWICRNLQNRVRLVASKIKLRFPRTLTDFSLILIFEFRLSWGWKRVTGSVLKDCFHRHHTSCTPQFICRMCSHGLRGDGCIYGYVRLLLAKSSRLRTLPVVFHIKQCSDCFTSHSMVDVSNKNFSRPMC